MVVLSTETITPRRSQRRLALAQTRDATPEVETTIPGPRSMMKAKKAAEAAKAVPQIKITRATILKEKKEEELTDKSSSCTQPDVSLFVNVIRLFVIYLIYSLTL